MFAGLLRYGRRLIPPREVEGEKFFGGGVFSRPRVATERPVFFSSQGRLGRFGKRMGRGVGA
jgi:hypothetical protein